MPHCKLSGKGPLVGNNVSHAHNKTKMVQQPNMQLKRIWVPELNKNVRIRLTTRALRTITKVGLLAYLRKNRLKLKDVTRS
jgi:large subunit ribosomal protein L28